MHPNGRKRSFVPIYGGIFFVLETRFVDLRINDAVASYGRLLCSRNIEGLIYPTRCSMSTGLFQTAHLTGLEGLTKLITA